MNLPRWAQTSLLLVICVSTLHSATIEILPPELRGAIQPQLAVSSGGVVGVAFGRTGSVYCVTSLDGGATFKRPVEIGKLPKLALGMRRGPRVAITESSMVVSAISHADGNLVAWVSLDQGATWAGATRVNSATNSAREGLHAMAGDGKGTVYISWLDLRNGRTELWLAKSTDAGRTWRENKQIYRSPDGHICECCHPSLAVDGRGRLWAMWRNWLNGARDMFASVSEDQGETFSPARKLGTGTWPLKGCPMDGGYLAFDAGGKLMTVWRRDKAVIAAGEAGETILSAQGLHPVMAMGSGAVHYLWQSGSRLMMKKGAGEANVFEGRGAFPAIGAGSPSLPPMVVWESNTNGLKTILARRLD